MHKLSINGKAVSLDGIELKGVVEYELKSSARSSTAELTLKMQVDGSNIFFNDGSNHTDSNLT